MIDIDAILDSDTPPQGITFDDLKRLVRAREYRDQAAQLFARMVSECGEDIAREVWGKVLPKRKRGNPRQASTVSVNALAYMRDLFNRSPDIVTGRAMTAKESAADIHEGLKFGNSVEAAEKTIARTRRQRTRPASK